MSEKLTIETLESSLHKAMDILRGSNGSEGYRNIFFAVLFLKRVSDVFEKRRNEVVSSKIDGGLTHHQATVAGDDKSHYISTFYIPASARWSSLQRLENHIDVALNNAIYSIEKYNPKLEGLSVLTEIPPRPRLTDRTLKEVISYFSQLNLCNESLGHPDILGVVFESLIKSFADGVGKRAGEFYTPSGVSQLLIALVKPSKGMRIYDPTAGSGSLLLQANRHIEGTREIDTGVALFGQEVNQSTWALCKMNMYLNGVVEADIKHGNTLSDPKHIHRRALMKFDRVVANPPFSTRNWCMDNPENDPYGRFLYGSPPKGNGDFAFVQHMISSANDEGIIGVVLPHGALFRASSEKAIRNGMLTDDLVEAVVGLPPGLLYGTAIPMCLLILNKKKKEARKNKVLFIDASHHFKSTHQMNMLRQEDIARIVDTFDRFESIGTFSKVLDVDELISHGANLNIKRYIDDSPIVQEIASLLKHHEGFERMSFSNEDLVNSIKVIKGESEEEAPNAIYLARHNAHEASIHTTLRGIQSKAINFIRVEFCKKKLINEYAKLFFESSLGRLMLRNIPTGASIQMLQAKSVQSLNIPIPSTTEQIEVIKVASKLQLAKQQIDAFFSKLTTEPKQYQAIEDQTDSMVYTLSQMTDAKHLEHLISFGETRHMEFKQSFFANADAIYSSAGKLEKNKDVQGEVIKDIASFMNAEGGTLLVGVNDKGKVLGIDKEMQRFGWKKVDNYFQELGAQLESRLSKDYHQFCRLTEVIIDEKIVARIDCKASPSPVFLDNEKFHVRTDTSSPPLVGEAMLRYIQNHFKVALINEQ